MMNTQSLGRNRANASQIIDFHARVKNAHFSVELGEKIDLLDVSYLKKCIQKEIRLMINNVPAVVFHYEGHPGIIRFKGQMSSREIAFDIDRFSGEILDIIYG